MTGRRIALVGTALAAEMIRRADIATLHGHEPVEGFLSRLREAGPEGWHVQFPREPRPFHPDANTVETRQQRRHRLRKG